MKLTIIGQWGGYPAPGGATSAYLIEKDNFSLLVDAGSGSLSNLQKYKEVMDLDAVVLSHYHHDHVADIGVLQYAWLVNSYVTGHDEILPIYGHAEDKKGFESLTHNCTEGIAYDPNEELKIGPFTLAFQRTKHSVPCFGMRISDGESEIVYTADTTFTEDWYGFVKDTDLLITDCNFYAGQDGSKAGHMNSSDGATIAREADAGELILSHLPQYGNNSDLVNEAKEIFTGIVHLAEAGLTWEK
ncbi:MBL fold metallo-hydrolase [Virgibacillus siamensis]|uniref:MBL fold metallo-hydrolase n=1 Tax=Virgibacillus siamensis TaxID=480071 RepID=UPI00098645D7|nr:MBL fold metallo-hydrolase [Virgibacillus siamensis]